MYALIGYTLKCPVKVEKNKLSSLKEARSKSFWKIKNIPQKNYQFILKQNIILIVTQWNVLSESSKAAGFCGLTVADIKQSSCLLCLQ